LTPKILDENFYRFASFFWEKILKHNPNLQKIQNASIAKFLATRLLLTHWCFTEHVKVLNKILMFVFPKLLSNFFTISTKFQQYIYGRFFRYFRILTPVANYTCCLHSVMLHVSLNMLIFFNIFFLLCYMWRKKWIKLFVWYHEKSNVHEIQNLGKRIFFRFLIKKLYEYLILIYYTLNRRTFSGL
jgi:hypothetical protein